MPNKINLAELEVQIKILSLIIYQIKKNYLQEDSDHRSKKYQMNLVELSLRKNLKLSKISQIRRNKMFKIIK